MGVVIANRTFSEQGGPPGPPFYFFAGGSENAISRPPFLPRLQELAEPAEQAALELGSRQP